MHAGLVILCRGVAISLSSIGHSFGLVLPIVLFRKFVSDGGSIT